MGLVRKLPEPSPPGKETGAQVELPARAEPQAAATSTVQLAGRNVDSSTEAQAEPTGTGSSADDDGSPELTGLTASTTTRPATASDKPVKQPPVEPLSAARYKVQFTASEQLVGKLRQAQELLRRQVPDGDPAVICEQALDLLIESLMKKRFALPGRKAAAPRRQGSRGDRNRATSKATSKESVVDSTPKSEQGVAAKSETKSASQGGASRRGRYIPAAVRRQVAERDGLRCTYVSPDGRRCERRDVEFHHLTPFARGGQHSVEEITLRCRAHNAFHAEQDYGAEHIARRIQQHQVRGRQQRASVRERALRQGGDGAPTAPGTAVQAEGR